MIKSVLKEFIFLIIALVATIIIGLFLFRLTSRDSTVDLHLHDTYFVIDSLIAYPMLFFLVSFLIFFIKEIPNKFSRRIPIMIMIVSALGFVASVIPLIRAFLS